MMKSQKGFTLIELLVVIAIIGVLAGVVLVAINPTQRIQEANDAGIRNGVGQAATALESCYTNNSGSYTNCANTGALVSRGFLKATPSAITVAQNAGTNAIAYGVLQATSSASPGCTSAAYYVYNAASGSASVICSAAAPTP